MNLSIQKGFRIRWRWGLLVAALVIAGGGVARLPLRSPHVSQNISDLTVPATPQTLTTRIEASGRVEPITTVNISPEITGRLVALQADQGDTVQAGQVLAQMLDAELRAQLAQAQAQLAEAEAEYDEIRSGNRPEEISRAQAQVDSAQAQFNLSTKRLERHQFLAQEGAIAQLDLDEIINEEQTARANLREAQQSLQELNNGARPKAIAQTAARVTAARAQIEVIQAQLDATVIRAPFDGIITQKYATVGAIVTPTTSASATASATSSSIFALASGLELLVDVPEANISQIEVGQPVEIVVDSYPDQTFEGRVRLISPEAVVEDNVTSFQVRIELLTGQSELRSGMNGDAIFIGESIADALMVPTVAITNQGQDIGVLVADEQGEARFQAISVGITQEGQTHVVSGLESGEKVFVDFPEGKVPGPTGGPL